MGNNEIDNILSSLIDAYPRLSDINITVGRPFQVESEGQLRSGTKLPIVSLTPFQTEIFALSIIQGNPQLLQALVHTGSCDCSYQLGSRARFRVNIFSQRGGTYSIVLRKLSTDIPSIKDMNLPDVFYKIAEERNGLILFTGATGTGKSTSLAALLRHINENKAVHVVTLEDPIEFEHPHINATFNQRELGNDFDSFASGMKAALRQAPKIILVGEMRDRETMEIGLTAAETGHLVMSTLHTINAGQTINRIVGMFEKEEEEFVRMRLAETVRWIVCQRLVPKIERGRVAVLEIMANTIRTREVIAHGESEDKQFYDIIASGRPYGMWTFDQHLMELFGQKLISEETAKSYCTRKSVTIQGLDKIKAAHGVDTSDIQNLEMVRTVTQQVAPEEIMPSSKKKNIRFNVRPPDA